MPRGKKNQPAPSGATPGPGNNKPPALTDDEAAALTTHYQLKIIEAQRKVDALMVDVKGARDTVNGHFKRMTADLKFTRQDFEREVIAKLNMTEAEYLSSERKRARLHKLAGLAIGEQLDLLDHIADTVDDEIDAEANGYRAGRRADDPIMPKTTHPMFATAWTRGYHKGVEENGALLAKAGEIIAARNKPVMVAEEPEEEPDEDESVEDNVRKLKARGFHKRSDPDTPTAAEAFEPQPAA